MVCGVVGVSCGVPLAVIKVKTTKDFYFFIFYLNRRCSFEEVKSQSCVSCVVSADKNAESVTFGIVNAVKCRINTNIATVPEVRFLYSLYFAMEGQNSSKVRGAGNVFLYRPPPPPSLHPPPPRPHGSLSLCWNVSIFPRFYSLRPMGSPPLCWNISILSRPYIPSPIWPPSLCWNVSIFSCLYSTRHIDSPSLRWSTFYIAPSLEHPSY